MLTAIINTLLHIPIVLVMVSLCIIVLIIAGTIFWIWMLVDCIINKRISDGQKAGWILAMLFTHFIGALLYLALGRTAQKPQITYQPYVQPRTPPAAPVPYYPYQHGYQAAQPPPPPLYQPEAAQQRQGAAQPPPPYEQQPPDYEQPQAMYPHEQGDN